LGVGLTGYDIDYLEDINTRKTKMEGKRRRLREIDGMKSDGKHG
jgi:hypothetical protein